MTVESISKIIIKAPHERAFEDAYQRQAPMTMRVRNEEGDEEDLVLLPMGEFTFVSVLNERFETVKQYSFQAVSEEAEDIIGIVTPAANTETIGELVIRRKVEIRSSKKFKPAFAMA